jgi:oxepin-CoA hydrolase/3-oxo-5,6-dehydrosuberyl-CoA semialdehyde dehydrogenase
MSPLLLGCERPRKRRRHEVEAFGPVATLMPYDSVAEAIELVRRGGGSLAASVYSYDRRGRERTDPRHRFVPRPHHRDRSRRRGRIRPGHGSPLPALIHGGPGRAGGGEELGGVRGVFHYMQRTAIQGRPRASPLTNAWSRGAAEVHTECPSVPPPLRRTRARRNDSHRTRTITLEDIEHFARIHRRHVLRAHG